MGAAARAEAPCNRHFLIRVELRLLTLQLSVANAAEATNRFLRIPAACASGVSIKSFWTKFDHFRPRPDGPAELAALTRIQCLISFGSGRFPKGTARSLGTNLQNPSATRIAVEAKPKTSS